MTANTAPIYTDTPKVGRAEVTAANTKNSGDGTIGTDLFLVFSAGADGSFLSRAQFHPVGETAATASTATMGRLYLSTNSSGACTGGTDTFLIGEVSLPAQTTDSTTAATNPVPLQLNFAIPSGYHVLASTHHAPAASTSQQVMVFGGDF